MAILCNSQAEKGPNIRYRKRRHHYLKDYGLFELQEQHLAYQVRSILKTGKLSCWDRRSEETDKAAACGQRRM